MTELKEYDEFSQGPLIFPIRGKKYAAPEISIELGFRLSGITTGQSDQDMPSLDMYKLLLGPVWDEMEADGVPLDAASRAALTTLNDFLYGRDYAIAFWETGLDPKATAALMSKQGNRAQRRSKRTATATKTP